MLIELFYTGVLVLWFPRNKLQKNSYRGNWGDKNRGAQDAICLRKEKKRETFRWGSAGTCRLSKKLITYSVPIVSHFREDGRTSQFCVLAELCSLGPQEILQGDRRQARTRRLRSL